MASLPGGCPTRAGSADDTEFWKWTPASATIRPTPLGANLAAIASLGLIGVVAGGRLIAYL
jgi:hypothetical protein